MQEKKLPTFLYIGAGRTGSTWIFKALDAHPDVFVPPAKELCFFNNHYDKGYSWYSNFFNDADQNTKALGELTPGYLYVEDAAKRIAQDFPSIKLFACLRNPIERAVSAYQFKKRNGIAESDFFSTLEKFPEILERSKYSQYIKMYADLFDKDNFKVFLYDDLQKNPVKFARDIYQFINVDSEFQYVAAKDKVLAAAQPRYTMLATFVHKASRVAHGLGWIKLIGQVRNSFLSQLLYKPVEKQNKENLTDDEMTRLIDYFSEDVRNLEGLLNRDLQHWLQNSTKT
jgi:hypothetical protein